MDIAGLYNDKGYQKMVIKIGSDHRGYQVKQRIINFLTVMGHEVHDVGPNKEECVDYPDYAFEFATAVSNKQADRGILICGTGIGMCIAANKVSGVRAAPCHDSITAEISRRHNDANVLCISADLLGEELIERMVKLWLETPFENGRHARRIEKILAFENGEREFKQPKAMAKK